MRLARLALPIALGVAACGPAPAQQHRDPRLKQLALARDHIPQSEGRLYEADRIVPLCLWRP